MQEEIRVEQPTLIHFINKIVELAKQGYVPSSTNQGAPQSWGLGLFTCGMVLESEQEKVVEQPKETVQESQPVVEEKSEETVQETKPKTTRRRKSTK